MMISILLLLLKLRNLRIQRGPLRPRSLGNTRTTPGFQTDKLFLHHGQAIGLQHEHGYFIRRHRGSSSTTTMVTGGGCGWKKGFVNPCEAARPVKGVRRLSFRCSNDTGVGLGEFIKRRTLAFRVPGASTWLFVTRVVVLLVRRRCLDTFDYVGKAHGLSQWFVVFQ